MTPKKTQDATRDVATVVGACRLPKGIGSQAVEKHLPGVTARHHRQSLL